MPIDLATMIKFVGEEVKQRQRDLLKHWANTPQSNKLNRDIEVLEAIMGRLDMLKDLEEISVEIRQGKRTDGP